MLTHDGLVRSAFREAHAMGHHWLGAEHVLLALVASTSDGPASRALAKAGVTHALTVATLQEHVAGVEPPVPTGFSGILSSPSFHEADAAVLAVALANRHDEPDEEDVLIGLLILPPDGMVGRLLADMGTTPDAVAAALEAEGVRAEQLRAHMPANPLGDLAARQAIERGRDYVADSDLLLALLAGEPDPVAREILGAAGLTYDAYRAFAENRDMTSRPPAPPPRAGVEFAAPTAAAQKLLWRAWGRAWREGTASVRLHHGLVAWLWWADGRSVLELDALSIDPDAIVAALAATGVPMPAEPLPQPNRELWGDDIDVPPDRLMEVVREVSGHDLPDNSWGFNTYEGTAWIGARASIDLRPVVARVLQRNPTSEDR